MSGREHFTEEIVSKIRALAARKKMTAKEIRDALNLNTSVSTLWRVIYNETWVNPKYKPPASRARTEFDNELNYNCSACGAKLPLIDFYQRKQYLRLREHQECKDCWRKRRGKARVVRVKRVWAKYEKRLPSIACLFTCPTCGGAYPEHGNVPFQSMAEALKCCRNVELAVKEA